MSLSDVESRLSPPAVYGQDLPRKTGKKSVYDNTLIPYFIMENGGEPRDIRDFLTKNRIGSVFDDMSPGMELKVEPMLSINHFSRHPEL